MYFKSDGCEYRNNGSGWQKKEFGKKWKNVPKNLWQSLYNLRKYVMQNRRPSLAETVRIRTKRYNEQTKKTSRFAYIHGVPLDQIITE